MSPLPDAELVEGKGGLPSVRVLAESGARVHLHSLYQPEAEGALLVPPPVGATTLVFLGCGLGYHLGPVLEVNPQARRLLLIERFPALAERLAARVAHQWPGVKVEVVTQAGDTPTLSNEPGPDPQDPPLATDLDPASLQVVSHPPSLAACPRWYARMHRRVAEAGLAPRIPPSGKRPRALCALVLHGGFYCEHESARGLELLGHRVVRVDYRNQEARFPELLRRTLVTEKPDLVVSVNGKGLSTRPELLALIHRLGIPLALWFVDAPEFILHGKALPPRDGSTLLLWDRGHLPLVRGLGYRASWLPLAADERLREAAVKQERYAAPLSFVGNSLLTGFLEGLALRLPRDPRLQQLVQEAIPLVLSARGHQLEALDRFVAEHAGLLPAGEVRLFFRAQALHGATSRYRIDLMQRLLPLGLHFFGDPDGWRRALGPHIPAHPDVNYFHQLPAVYASSEVNFSATSLQMPQAVNQRVFDVPLCGGFLLTDRQLDLAELFAEDEVATYASPDEVALRARHFLDAPALRREVAVKAQRRVLGEHTYRTRMEQLLRAVFA